MKNNFVKQFVMPVVILLIICVVCVGVLAVLNDVLYVYVETAYDTVTGQILGSVENEDGSYTITALGKNGYSGGTVTMDVTIDTDGTITAVALVESVNQSFIDNFSQENFDSWYVGQAGDIALDDSKLAGASGSSTAINNAVNIALDYASIYLEIGGAN